MYIKAFVLLLGMATTTKTFSQIDHPAFRYISNDSVETYASGHYRAHSFLRHWLMGKNYRREWQQTVRLPVFRLSKFNMKIEELGGGMQTKSLKLEDATGREWALRSVDKDVAGALPKFLEQTFAHKVAQDHISASLPYGAPVVGALAKAVGVIAANPVVYFVADDPGLGPYRSIFANTVCMLEERDPKFGSTKTTEEVLHKIQSDNNSVINQKSLLKARLIDMLVSDWDRHFDNWRWGKKDSAGLNYYYAIPRDRDWAFYYSGGLVPKLARIIALRHFVNFQKEPRYLKSLNAKTHLFDAVFLNSLDASDWRETIHEFQRLLTDKAIDDAVRTFPSAVFASSAASFSEKLKSRRDVLENEVMDYYNFLSRHMQIEGTNEEELFSILPAEGGFTLQIFQLKNGNRGLKIYERRFVEGETYRLTLNGLGGNDRFEISENARSSIRLKLNGGTGKDNYHLAGKIRVAVYDEAAEDNLLANKNGAKITFR